METTTVTKCGVCGNDCVEVALQMRLAAIVDRICCDDVTIDVCGVCYRSMGKVAEGLSPSPHEIVRATLRTATI